jgi:hypothetical protein
MTVRRAQWSLPTILIAVVILAAGCRATPPSSESAPALASPARGRVSPSAVKTAAPTASGAERADNPVDRVLAISIDGLNPRAIQLLGPSHTRTFHRLMREGAYT